MLFSRNINAPTIMTCPRKHEYLQNNTVNPTKNKRMKHKNHTQKALIKILLAMFCQELYCLLKEIEDAAKLIDDYRPDADDIPDMNLDEEDIQSIIGEINDARVRLYEYLWSIDHTCDPNTVYQETLILLNDFDDDRILFQDVILDHLRRIPDIGREYCLKCIRYNKVKLNP